MKTTVKAWRNGKNILIKPFRHKTLEERAAAYGGKLEIDTGYAWGEPVGSEIW